ncbi:MAG: DNA polymerase III subunit delta' [Pseudomonadota bacterium]
MSASASSLGPRPDILPGLPAPFETEAIFGHDSQIQTFLDGFTSGKLHHAWMLTGAQGSGKASFAYHIAKFLLATPPIGADDGLFGAPPTPQSTEVGSDHPVTAQIKAGAHPGLFVLRRGLDEASREPKLKTAITIGEARKLKDFLALSSADGGHRVVIIDAADEMNISAANAILKLLEEPPTNTVFFLICHQPTRLLPTIRSRCRTLAFQPLDDDTLMHALTAAGVDMPEAAEALFALSDGSVGRACQLIANNGLQDYAWLIEMLKNAPGMDRAAWTKRGETLTGRAKEQAFDLFEDQVSAMLSRLSKAGVLPLEREAAPGERSVAARLAPDLYAAQAWSELTQEIVGRLRQGRAVNLDPAALVLDTGLKIDDLARRLTSRK